MEKTAYQEIVDKIHFYMENPHLNPMDMDYVKCKDCSFDLLDDEGNLLEHYCRDNKIK